MASTSHRLSVWTNTCIKAPINSRTGLNATLQNKNTAVTFSLDDFTSDLDRARLIESNNYTDFKGVCNVGHDHENDLYEYDPQNRGMPLSKEEEFYYKLQKLKEENKKTLEAYNKLYQEKILIEGIRNSQDLGFHFDESGVDKDVDKDFLSVSGKNAQTTLENKHNKSKPPTGRSKVMSSESPVLSKTLPQKSLATTKKQRPSSAPHERRSQSLDDSEWGHLFNRPNGLKNEDNFVISTDEDQALEKIKKMWEDFKISDSPERRHSFSSSRQKQDKNVNEKKEWRHRITIPQPFTMSIREALKEKKKTRTQEELEKRVLEKKKQEEAECEKKFKAQPVPSHVYLPKYEEIMEKNESRRQYVKHYCKELLESQVKPFHFELREKEKKIQRAQSAPIKTKQNVTSTFKAKPVPKHIFSPEIDEKFLEEEELRKIRVRMRAKELLREAALPPSMAEREKLKDQEKATKQGKFSSKKKPIRHAHSVPDYDALYKEFQKELSRRKSYKEGTVVVPFNLETEKIHSHREKMKTDVEDYEKHHWPTQSSKTTPRSSLKYLGALSNSLDSIPALSSKAADLRAIKAKKEQERLNHRLIEKEEAEKRRQSREAKLRHHLKERINDDIPNPRDSIAERLKKRRQEDRLRQEAYQREIDEMKQKIEQSPLLVEKYMAEKAKAEAENKFSKVLKHAGLNEKELSSFRPSSSPDHRLDSSFNDTDRDLGYTNQVDLTYTKGISDEE